MLSKKMTFSLMSLITIIALAFVAPSAMAQDFDVTLDVTGDISEAGDLQVLYVGQTELTVTFKSAEAIVLPAASVFATTYDEMDKLVSIPAVTVTPTTAEKTLMVTIPVDESIFRVNIKINEGIVAADPLNAKKSKKVDVNIHLVNRDRGGPTVYSIRRAADPLLPVTADTFQVIITLSEMAKEFKKGNVRISDNATITKDPEALVPVREITATQALANARITRTFRGVPPVVRGLYDADLNGSGVSNTQADIRAGERGAHGLIAAIITPAAGGALTDANALPVVDATADPVVPARYQPSSLSATELAALEKTILESATAFEESLTKAMTGYYAVANIPAPVDVAAYTTALAALLPVTMPATASWPLVAPSKMVTIYYSDANLTGKLDETTDDDTATGAGTIAFPDVSEFPGDAPDPGMHETLDAYNLALRFYNYKKLAKDIYDAMVMVHTAYNNAVNAVQALDSAAAEAYLLVELETSPGDPPAIQLGTGRDNMLYPYVVTIAPKYANKDDIIIKAGAFEDTTKPISLKYIPPDQRFPVQDLTEGVNMLTVKVGREDLVTLAAGSQVYLDHADGTMIPGNGFLLLTKDKDGSGINHSNQADNENKSHLQTPAQLLFNVRNAGIPNLENFFLQGGTIDLVAYDGTAATAAYISEVMWGSDASQADSFKSQWIEIANTTASAISVAEKKWALWLYQAHETPPAAYPDSGVLIDRIGTERSDTGVFWSVVGTAGQSGRTNIDPGGADVVAIAPTKPLISMVRVMDAAGAAADGTLPTSWASSTGPSVNFKLGIEGTRLATPGAADIARPTAPPPTVTPPTVPPAVAADIMISEIMVATDSGRLPQWIELTHVGTGEVSLDGWEMVIDNAIDADVIGGGNAITVSLSGVTLDVSAHTGNTGKGQSALVVAWAASRHSANIRADRIVNIATQLNQTRRYQLLSYKGFRVTLVPPQTGAIAAFGDVAGNLDEEWEIPMAEGTRSSMIRREMAGTPAAATMGTDAKGWILASSTPLITGQQSYYGSDEDAGTPGQDAGGPLPVELSHFRPARDKQTGAAVITWATQSELNNAGFFIKRSNQRNGQFKVVNATMIAGAGTTSEKQFYTYTDTTAQPNVVYYYQIEDVSLDGNRQLLTRGIRLKGHVGAAGKATVTWGELKTSHE